MEEALSLLRMLCLFRMEKAALLLPSQETNYLIVINYDLSNLRIELVANTYNKMYVDLESGDDLNTLKKDMRNAKETAFVVHSFVEPLCYSTSFVPLNQFH